MTSGATFSEVEVRAVSKVYGRRSALSQVSLRFSQGELTALLGDNGAGKSTLIGILSTLTRPSSGTLSFGADSGGDRSELRAQIGLCGHESFLYGDLTGLENLEFYARLYGLTAARQRAEAGLRRAGLADEAAQRPLRTYSRGMTQRLAIARTLLHEPQLVLFDEPFTGLDRAGQVWLQGLLVELKAAGRIVVVVTHDLLGVAGIAGHVVVLRRGKVVTDQRQAGTSGTFDHSELVALYGGGNPGAVAQASQAPHG